MSEMFEQTLLNMGIYELRNYAREVGVNSPTTLKRHELIEAIIAVKTGTVKPVKGLTRGRKPKNKEKVNLTQFLPPELTPYDFSNNFETYKVSEPNEFFSGQFFGDGSGVLLSGELEKTETGNYVLFANNFEVQIDKTIVNEFQVGENVLVNCKHTEQPNKLIATNIFKTQQNIKAFNELEVIEKHRNLNFNTENMLLKEFAQKNILKAGQCIQVTYEKEINPEFVINEIVNAVKNNADKKIAIVSTNFKTTHIKAHCENIFEISTISDAIQRVNQIEQAVNHAKRLVELNNNCCLFIGSMSAIYNAYFQASIIQNGSENLAKNYALQKVAQIMALARQTSKCSLTIFAFAQKQNEKTDFCEEEISAEINFSKKNNEFRLKDSFSIYKLN